MPNCTAWTFLTGADECVILSMLTLYPKINGLADVCGLSVQGRMRALLGEAQRMIHDGESLLSGKQPPLVIGNNSTALCDTLDQEDSETINFC